MNNYAILGPNTLLNDSTRRRARKLVRKTVNRNWFNNAYQASNRHYIVMNTRGKLMGFALVDPNKGTDMRIHLIGTKQGLGIGRMLMQQILNNARNRGLKTVTLESVNEARGFYNKMGFTRFGLGNNMRYYLFANRRTPSSRTPARASASRSARPVSASRGNRQTPLR